MHRVMSFDFETYSETDIASCGSYKYIEDPAFEILLLSYAFDDEPVKTVDFAAGEDWPQEFLDALPDPSITKTAYNAAFERYALERALGLYQDPAQYEDTMVLAAVCGLPLSLSGACEALHMGDDVAKMKEGKALIRYFCSPCKPTKTNGGRTRNLPEHAPEKWDLFKTYNAQDVVAERAVRNRLLRYRPDDIEHKFWAVNTRLNERGVRIDTTLARQAVAIDDEYKARLTEEAIALTGLENPKSVAQIKAWLKDQEGLDVASLNKKVVADVVGRLQTDAAREFMRVRAALAKSSTSKYAAMLRSLCADGTVKGTLLFYGASRTGRFAGRIVQPQNLPQNHIPDLATARSLVRAGDAETVDLLYESISDTLSQLIRTAFLPEAGQRLIVSDFSAIEARVIAWFAGEEWRLKVFEDGGDIYCQSASQMFKVPVVKHGINGELRQKGKVAELACIAEGQQVLTDAGLVPIERVTTEMKVWDGVEWVSHGGVVCRGEKEVLTYGGLEATADHVVWAAINGEARQVHFGDAATCGAHLIQTGAGRQPIRLGGDHHVGASVEQSLESLLCTDPLQRLRRDPVAAAGQSAHRKVEGLPELHTTEGGTGVVIQEIHGRETALHEPEGQQLQELRGAGHRVSVREHHDCVHLYDRESRTALSRDGAGPDRCEWALRTGELALGDASTELREPAAIPRKVKVYDIINAGPRHRFTVSNVLVHNCGYGGGVSALIAFGADKMGMSDEEMAETVAMWRDASPNICRLWKSLENAAIKAITKKSSAVSRLGNVRFDYENGILWMNLPSGRRIAYWDAQYAPSKWKKGQKAISYMGLNDKNKWARIETWGGKLVENLVQATARDCLRDKILALDAAGFDIRMHVHDEIVVTEPLDGKTLEQMNEIMNAPLPWAEGLPLRGDGYYCDFYQKD